jgi:hypothetical protein
MRTAWSILLFVVVFTNPAWSHGGTYRGPSGYWKRGIQCSCAKVECEKCSLRAYRIGTGDVTCSEETTVVKRWGDITQLRIVVRYGTEAERANLEGYTCLQPATVFAAVGGRIEQGESTLVAGLLPSEETRQKYLWERRRSTLDPMLVLRRGPGRVDLRAFPILQGQPVTVTVEGFALGAAPAGQGPRLYRTGERCLAVVPLADAPDGAAMVDTAGGRALFFLSEVEARERYPRIEMTSIPCVRALETAVTGAGTQAAAEVCVLAALDPRCKLPPFIGPDSYVSDFSVPPGLRDPRDPPPPPEPPAAPPPPPG